MKTPAPSSNIRGLTSLLASFLVLLTFASTSARAQTTPAANAATATSASASVQPRARVTQAVDDTKLLRLAGNVHPLAKAKFDKGAVDDAQPATRALILLQRSTDQEAALRQLLDDQQNPSSANFHNWLTPTQFGAQFGPADSDVQAVTQWLTTHGFQGIKVGEGKTVVEFSGTVGQMREAFHTDIHQFLIRGELRNANVRDPQIPVALSPVIAGVVGLSNFRPRAHVHQLGTFRKTKATGEVKPLFTFTGCGSSGTLPCFAVGPGDFAKIYNVPSLVNGNPAGQGQTIVVVNDSNINVQDVVDYRNIFGLPANFSSSNVIVNGPDPGITGDELEADLDTQISGAVAPNATILLVLTEQPDSGVGAAGVDLSVLFAINNNLAPVISKSFGACEAFEGASGNQLESALWEQGSAQGISGMVSAGDSGSAACDPADPVDFPDLAIIGQAVSGDASTPFNVAVGGTDFNSSLPNYATTFWGPAGAATTSALSYIPEITWNDSCASSGSTSACTPAIISEDVVTENDVVGGGGGQSNCINPSTDNSGNLTCNVSFDGKLGYLKPSWQAGPGVPADGLRDLPDVSLFASNGENASFYIVCEQDANGTNTSSCDLNSPFLDFQGVGGTSASSPAFAAIMALVNQQTGQRQGNPNYVLYPLAAKAGSTCTSQANPLPNVSTCIFYDIPAGSNNSVACAGGSFGCSNGTNAANEVGILVVSASNGNPTNPITPAFNTTAGYDLATGLGSVNVTNLVKNWTSVTPALVGTSTTFQLGTGAPITSDVHGTAVAVSGKVTPASGTAIPTGFVELIQGTVAPGPVIDTFAVQSDGTFTGSTTLLPGTNGTPYSVVMHYGGDTAFRPSTSNAESVASVTKEPSKVSVNLVQFDANGNPLTPSPAATTLSYGSPYILLVAVTNNGGSLCTPPPFSNVQGNPSTSCPTGTVMLFDGNPPAPLNNFVVPNTTTPTNAAKLNNSGFAEDQPIQLPGGSHSITATYAGDNSFNANTASNTLSLTITPATTQITVAANSTSIVAGSMVTLTATVVGPTSNGAAPTGTVQFTNGSTALASAPCGSGTPFNQNTGAPPMCTASITTALSLLAPPAAPWQMPRIKSGPMWSAAFALLALFLLLVRRVAPRYRPAYACIGLLLFACAAAGIAGCGGGSSTTGHTDTIKAAYSGDTNYATSTAQTAVSVQ
jgi:hypothetical protein